MRWEWRFQPSDFPNENVLPNNIDKVSLHFVEQKKKKRESCEERNFESGRINAQEESEVGLDLTQFSSASFWLKKISFLADS